MPARRAYDASTGQALAAVAVAGNTGLPPHLDLFGLHDGSSSLLVSDLGSYLCGALAVAAQARVAAVPLTTGADSLRIEHTRRKLGLGGHAPINQGHESDD